MDWDARWREKDTPWDKGVHAPPLEAWLAKHSATGAILVPGCGSGHDVRLLARNPAATVTGLDLSPTAIREAQRFAKTGSERYVVGDFFDLPPEFGGTFDWVVEHTCFCAIDPSRRADYVRAVRHVLKPGGHLLGVFFINPDHDEDGPPYGASPEELEALFGPTFELRHSRVPEIAYEGREGRELLQLRQRQA